MKRLLSALILIPLSLTMFCISAGAEEQTLSMKYVPRTQRGTLFYIDVYSDLPVSAALFELEYDPDAAEFRGAFSEEKDADVIGVADGTVIGIAYTHRSSGQGVLYRVAFKALTSGNIDFRLRMTQAVDSSLRYLSDLPSCTLSVKLGRDDVVSQAASGSAQGENSAGKSDKQTYGGSKSTAARSDIGGSDRTDPTDGDGAIFRDFGGQNKWAFFLWGAAAALVVVLSVAAGILIGRRTKKKQPEENEAEKDDEDPEADETADPASINNSTKE